MKKKWWKDGIRFACQGSGKCCVSRGQFGFVYLTLAERKQAASYLKIETATFTRKYCKKTGGVFHLNDMGRSECVFLEDKRCSIYEARPMQCRTWPFWPEVMSAKSWSKEVQAFCPGVGKGPIVKPERIHQILTRQEKWEDDLGSGR